MSIPSSSVSRSASAELAATRLIVAPADEHGKLHVYGVTLLLLALLWSFVAFLGMTFRQETIEASERVLNRMNHAVVEQTRRQFKLVEVSLALADQWMADFPGADPRTDARLAHLIGSFHARTGNAVTLYLADAQGRSFSLAPPQPLPEPLGDMPYFRAALGGDAGSFHIGSPLKVGSPEAWKIPVVQRLTRPVGGVAALIALVDMGTLMGLYEEERMRPNGAIVLLHRDGTLLARAPHDERLLGKSLVGGQLYREFLPRRESGFAKLDRTATDAKEKYVSYASMSDYPLLVVVSAAKDDVLAPWQRQVTIIAMLAAAVSLIALIVAQRLATTLSALSAHAAEMHHLATIDAMTGVNNRHHFLQLLYHEFARSRRYRTPLSLLVFDLDFFKRINDGYGHAAGDEALRAFAAAAGDSLREVDAIGRLGGEEFGILLPNATLDQAETVAERIRSAVAMIAINTEYGTVRFTTSVGVTQVCEDDSTIDALLGRADGALYAAKAAGRNRVVARAG